MDKDSVAPTRWPPFESGRVQVPVPLLRTKSPTFAAKSSPDLKPNTMRVAVSRQPSSKASWARAYTSRMVNGGARAGNSHRPQAA